MCLSLSLFLTMVEKVLPVSLGTKLGQLHNFSSLGIVYSILNVVT